MSYIFLSLLLPLAKLLLNVLVLTYPSPLPSPFKVHTDYSKSKLCSEHYQGIFFDNIKTCTYCIISVTDGNLPVFIQHYLTYMWMTELKANCCLPFFFWQLQK